MLCGVVSHISGAEIERLRDRNPRDLGARDLARQALPLILNANAVSAQKAVAILNRAVDMDPADAVVVGLLAFAQLQLAGYYGTESPVTANDAAVRLSQRAALLDNNDPQVLVVRGAIAEWLQYSDQAYALEADALLTRALAIDPTSPWAWERRAYARICQDPGLAIAEFQRALRLRGPGMARSNCLHGIACAHHSAGRSEEAGVWLRRAMAENPGADWMHRTISRAAWKRGDLSGVAESVERLRRAFPFLTVSFLADHYPVPVCEAGWLDAVARAGMPLT